MVHFIRHQPHEDLATLTTGRQHDYVIGELSKGDYSKGITYARVGEGRR